MSPEIVTAELGVIAIESEKRHSETGELVIATAAEFHHRAVWVHPFEDVVHARTTIAYWTLLIGLFVSKVVGYILSQNLRRSRHKQQKLAAKNEAISSNIPHYRDHCRFDLWLRQHQ